MDTLDIILINTISYMSGIFTGLVISYKLRSNKNCNREKDKKNNKGKEETRIIEREYHEPDTNKYRSPLQTALTYPSAPSAPPPLALNPEYMNDKSKKITITTE